DGADRRARRRGRSGLLHDRGADPPALPDRGAEPPLRLVLPDRRHLLLPGLRPDPYAHRGARGDVVGARRAARGDIPPDAGLRRLGLHPRRDADDRHPHRAPPD
ncbi:MAG: hypothetical protein AVDCRST_MAG30-383, partial [uncultured Solirubrobacteraceae bacterium]